MKYRAIQKTQIITENQQIEADGWTNLQIYNTGNVPVVLFGELQINGGGDFAIDDEPYVEQTSPVNITFADHKTTDKARAFIIKTYYIEQ